MPQVLIRNIEHDVLERLKRRAMENGRTLQAELRDILARAAAMNMAEARRRADEIRAKLAGRTHTNGAEILAEDRAL